MTKNTILILLLIQITCNLFSQEIENQYLFKKEIKSSKSFNFNCIELDNLVLYKNKSYSRTYSYQCHELKYSEEKGMWFIKDGILSLIATGNKSNRNDSNWKEVSFKYEYRVKKNKLIFINRYNSLNENIDYSIRRKLKRRKNVSQQRV